MDTPVTPSIGLFHADKQTVEALGPVVQLAKSGFFYCTQGEMSLVLGNRAFEIHRGDIYIYPPLSKTYIRMLSDDLHGTVGVADFDFVFTLANSISNTQNHLYMRENPCISLNDEQRRRIEELIELIWRRERSQGSRSTNENNRLIYNQLLSSLGKALCCEIAEAYFFNHPIQPLKQDRKDRIFQSFIFSLSQNFRTHHSVSFYAAEQCLTPRHDRPGKIGPQRPAMDHDVHYRRGEEAALRSRSEHQGDRRNAGILQPVLLRPLFQAIRRSLADGIPLLRRGGVTHERSEGRNELRSAPCISALPAR